MIVRAGTAGVLIRAIERQNRSDEESVWIYYVEDPNHVLSKDIKSWPGPGSNLDGYEHLSFDVGRVDSDFYETVRQARQNDFIGFTHYITCYEDKKWWLFVFGEQR